MMMEFKLNNLEIFKYLKELEFCYKKIIYSFIF